MTAAPLEGGGSERTHVSDTDAVQQPGTPLEGGGSEWTHALESTTDAVHLLGTLVFEHYPRWCDEGGVSGRQRQLREDVVSLHGCVLGILEGVARLLEGAEEGEELNERVRTVRDALSSLPRPTENLPPPYEPSR